MKHNAFLEMFDDSKSTEGLPLSGLKIAIKDNMLKKGKIASAGSKILSNHKALYDSTVVERLEKAGAEIIGRTNMDEFAMGSSTENSAYGVTENPWDTSRVPGGSSGGSAAAVAMGAVDVAMGSDTGGSIRQPAAFCGVTGFKPTYGAVSRYGLIAMASSFDQIGPLAKDAQAIEKIMQVIAGKDIHDQTTVDYSYQPTDVDLSGIKIGLPKELLAFDIDPEIKAATEALVDFYKIAGAEIKEVSIPSIHLSLATYYIIMPAEISSNLARFDGIRYGKRLEGKNLLDTYLNSRDEGFGGETKRRILLGTFVLSHGYSDKYYMAAIALKQKIADEHNEALKEADFLICPTTPTLPFKIGERVSDPVKMYQSDLLTVGVNLAGLPAISIPTGFSSSNLPIGSQIIGRKFEDNRVISLAKQFQAKTNFHTKEPNNG